MFDMFDLMAGFSIVDDGGGGVGDSASSRHQHMKECIPLSDSETAALSAEVLSAMVPGNGDDGGVPEQVLAQH